MGLLAGCLRLNISAMKDMNIAYCFNTAKDFLNENPVYVFTRQLDILKESISIMTQIVYLASVTRRKWWPLLALTAMTPVLEGLVRTVFSKRVYSSFGIYFLKRLLILVAYCEWREIEELCLRKDALGRLARAVGFRPEIQMLEASSWILREYEKASKEILRRKKMGVELSANEQPSLFHRLVFLLLPGGSQSLLYLMAALRPGYFDLPIARLTDLGSAVENIVSSIRNLRELLSLRNIKDLFKIRNLFECIETQNDVSVRANPAPYKSNPRGMKIEFRDVTFNYNKETPPVLKNVNFIVEPGQIVGIVGYNGSGKSTLIQLLTLREQATSGEIFFNDINISEYHPKILHRNISTLFQDFRISSQCITNFREV